MNSEMTVLSVAVKMCTVWRNVTVHKYSTTLSADIGKYTTKQIFWQEGTVELYPVFKKLLSCDVYVW